MTRGKLIVLEGADGAGKSTQAKLLAKRLNEVLHLSGTNPIDISVDNDNSVDEFYAGKSEEEIEALHADVVDSEIPVTYFSFPVKDSPTAHNVINYLSGSECWVSNGYQTAIFYLNDMLYHTMKYIVPLLELGHNVVVDRYIGSLLQYQSLMIETDNDLIPEIFVKYMKDLAYNKLGLPKPDMIIYLDISPKNSAKLLSARTDVLDIHEANEHFVNRVYVRGKLLAAYEGYEIINVNKTEDTVYSIEEVSDMIWEKVSKLLNEED